MYYFYSLFVVSSLTEYCHRKTIRVHYSTIQKYLNKPHIKKGNTITLNIPKGSVNVIFSYPASLNDVTSVKYVEGMNAEIKDVFTKTTALINGANNSNPDTYNIYTYTL